MGTIKPFIFRSAKEQDLEFIHNLSAQVFSKYGHYDEIVSHWFLEPAVVTEIIMERNDPLGFAMLTLERQKVFGSRGAHLLAIGISPDYQRRGVGTALLEHMEKVARKYKAGEMRLWTAVDNKAALSFFQRGGFKIIGSEKRYYPKGQTALAMSKRLDPT